MKYTIWMEGFLTNGDKAEAHLVGTFEAASFEEACQKAFEGDPLYNQERNTYWGCGLYDNEAAARKSFG